MPPLGAQQNSQTCQDADSTDGYGDTSKNEDGTEWKEKIHNDSFPKQSEQCVIFSRSEQFIPVLGM